MAKRCYYETLSVERTANDGAIKAAFRKQAQAFRTQDRAARISGEIEKQGFDTGFRAINPFTKQPVPIWVANFVLGDYGTGAVMAMPTYVAELLGMQPEDFSLLYQDTDAAPSDMGSCGSQTTFNSGRAVIAAAADLRGTGYPDLFIANDYGVSELFANQAGKSFIEIGKPTGIGFAPKSGMNVSFGNLIRATAEINVVIASPSRPSKYLESIRNTTSVMSMTIAIGRSVVARYPITGRLMWIV